MTHVNFRNDGYSLQNIRNNMIGAPVQQSQISRHVPAIRQQRQQRQTPLQQIILQHNINENQQINDDEHYSKYKQYPARNIRQQTFESEKDWDYLLQNGSGVNAYRKDLQPNELARAGKHQQTIKHDKYSNQLKKDKNTQKNHHKKSTDKKTPRTAPLKYNSADKSLPYDDKWNKMWNDSMQSKYKPANASSANTSSANIIRNKSDDVRYAEKNKQTRNIQQKKVNKIIPDGRHQLPSNFQHKKVSTSSPVQRHQQNKVDNYKVDDYKRSNVKELKNVENKYTSTTNSKNFGLQKQSPLKQQQSQLKQTSDKNNVENNKLYRGTNENPHNKVFVTDSEFDDDEASGLGGVIRRQLEEETRIIKNGKGKIPSSFLPDIKDGNTFGYYQHLEYGKSSTADKKSNKKQPRNENAPKRMKAPSNAQEGPQGDWETIEI